MSIKKNLHNLKKVSNSSDYSELTIDTSIKSLNLAPRGGFEPPTTRLTVVRSTTELSRNFI
jgi:hypothetical protein